jgi:hypothetical protein
MLHCTCPHSTPPYCSMLTILLNTLLYSSYYHIASQNEVLRRPSISPSTSCLSSSSHLLPPPHSPPLLFLPLLFLLYLCCSYHHPLGVSHGSYESDIAALRALRELYEYLPLNNRMAPPIKPTEDSIYRAEESLRYVCKCACTHVHVHEHARCTDHFI